MDDSILNEKANCGRVIMHVRIPTNMTRLKHGNI